MQSEPRDRIKSNVSDLIWRQMKFTITLSQPENIKLWLAVWSVCFVNAYLRSNLRRSYLKSSCGFISSLTTSGSKIPLQHLQCHKVHKPQAFFVEISDVNTDLGQVCFKKNLFFLIF